MNETPFEKIRALKKELDAQIAAVGEEAVKAEFTKFFYAHPDILGMSWTEYTPYFNDGDACVFHVHSYVINLWLKGDDDDEYTEEYDRKNREAYEGFYKTAAEFLKGIKDDDIFLAVFGDHVRVKATRKGFSVEEYEHD